MKAIIPSIPPNLALLTKAVFSLQTTEKAGARHTSKEFKALNRIIQVALELGAELPQAEQGPVDDPEKRRQRRQLIQDAWTTRAGAKHSRQDTGMIQELHDLSIEMGGVCKVKGPYARKSSSNVGINHLTPVWEVDIGGVCQVKGPYTGQADISEIHKNRESSTADQVRARDAVNNAIKAGKLPHAKTLKCYRCKVNRADQYHHPRGWSKGFLLTVRPICSKCHRALTPNGKKADVAKGQNDAPNYRSADSPKACTNCRFFSKKVGNQFCSLFNFMFADNYVCNAWETMEPSLIPGFMGQADVIQGMGLIEMAEDILALRGAGGSGNWGHSGRLGKLGGSGKGGGLKRIGAKPGSSVGARKKAAKKFQAKGKKQADKPKIQAKPATKKTAQKKDDKVSSKEEKRFGWRSKDMKGFEEENAGSSKESGAAYDKNGKELFTVKGKTSSVEFNDDQLKQMKGAIVTHNHPSTIDSKKFSDGGSFSESDIQLMLNTGAAEVRAVTDNFIYTVKPKLAGGRPIKNVLNSTNLKKRKGKIQADLSRKFRQGKVSREDFPIQFWHELWSDASKDGLIDYKRIKR